MKALVLRGLVATLAAMVCTAAIAALLRGSGVELEIDDGETIPVSGVATVTGFFSLVGVVIAVALRRWSDRPARRFVWVAGVMVPALARGLR